MKKRVLSLFMALALCLTMLPTAALAEEAGAAPDTGNVESVYTIGDDTVVQIGEESDPVQVAQALIDALPEDVTAENADEIEQQLMALEAALEALTAEQLALLDMTRYEALCAALVSQVSLTAERGGEHADHPICGDVSCTKHGGSLTGWVGVSELSDNMEAGYYYLTGPVTRTSTWYPQDGVVLCLNGYNISMDAKNNNNDSTICVNGGVTFTLCDCKNKGTVTHGMNGTAKYIGSGVWVESGNRAGKANFVLYSGSVSGNEYDNFCAGVHVGANANFTMHGGSISGNKTAGYGGGVSVQAGSASFTMTGGTIAGNNAGRDGGGVYVKNGAFTMTGGSITGNTVGSGYNGGGVYAYMNANVTLSGAPVITGNNDTSSKVNNVYLNKDEFYGEGKTLIGKGGLSSAASIGVTVDADKMPTTDGSYTTIAEAAEGYTITADDAKQVSADAGTGYSVRQKDNTLVLVKGELPHQHPVCGKTCGHTGNEKHTDDIEWKPVSSLSDITEAGSYYLTKDVETSGTWEPTNGVNLCLNGHSIKCTNTAEYYPVISIKEDIAFTLTDCEGDETPHTFKKDDTGRWVQDASGEITVKGVIFRATDVSGGGVEVSGGTFNMYGGTVCGGRLGSGSGVGVYSGNTRAGTFNMYGGRISGNTATATSDGGGGGVYVCNSSTFNMSGNAAVSENTAKYGGGVYLRSSTFNMSGNAAVSGNTAENGSGGVFVAYGSEFTTNDDAVISGNSAANYGGGVYLSGGNSSPVSSFTMNNGTISDNHSDNKGGGVFVHSNGKFTMAAGAISGNSATQNGGGVYVEDIGTTFTMKDGTIGGSTAADANTAKYGGGVYVKNGTFTMSGGKVTGNSATEDGGGVRLDKGTFHMSGSAVISRNTTNTYGGGVDVNNGSFTMSGGSITGNNAAGDSPNWSGGGGVFVYDGGSFTMSGGSITGNNAIRGGGVELTGINNTMTVSGSVQIRDNWRNGTLNSASGVYEKGGRGKPENLYLYSGKTVAIGTDGLNADAHIGVSTEDWPDPGSPVKIATNATNEESHYTAIFTPDAEEADYKITKKNGNALYLSAHEHTWTYTANDETKTISAACSECRQSGGSVTLKAPEAPTGTLTYTGKDQPATYTGTLYTGETPTITYSKQGKYGPETLENGALPKSAYTYTATLSVGGKSVSVNYTIEKAPLTIKANDAIIVYGETASSNGVTYSGFVNGETESVLGGDLTYTFSYIPGSDTGLYIITPQGLTSGNYDITFTPGTLTVTQREVTLTWAGYENRTYHDGVSVTAAAGNLVNNDEIKVTVSGGGEQTSGTHTATATGLTGAKADNYKLPTTGLTKEYTIGLAAQTLTFKSGTAPTLLVTYGGTLDNPATNDRTDGGNVTYTSSNEQIATVDENGTVTAKKVGTATITATAAAVDGKYAEATASYELKVIERNVTVTVDAVSRVYGDANPDFTAELTSGTYAPGDDFQSLDLTLSTTADKTTGVGSYNVTGTASNTNYNVTVLGKEKLTITQRPITFKVDPVRRAYGDANPAFTANTVTAGSRVNQDMIVMTLTTTATRTSPVGSYDVTLLSSDSPNYNITVEGTDALTIDPKPITVTVDAASRVYGSENPAFTATAPSGALVGEDTVASLNLTLTTDATATSPVGTYDVTGTANNGNYDVTVDGMNKLTVTKKELTVNDLVFADTPITKVYDGSIDAAITVQIKDSAKVNADDELPTVTGTCTYNSKDVKTANKVTFVSAKTESANYIFPANLTMDHEATITKRVITIASVQATSKQYDRDTNAWSCITGVTFNNLVAGETLTKGTDYGIPVANFDNANVGEAKTITGKVGIMKNDLNYTFGSEDERAAFTTTGSITPANSWAQDNVNLTIRYNNRAEQRYQAAWSSLPTGQKWTYNLDDTKCTGNAKLASHSIGADTGVLSYQLSAGDANDTVTWTITASCANYQSFTLNVTLTLIARDQQTGFQFENNNADVTKTYGDEDFTISASGEVTGSSVTYTSSDETVAKVDEDGKVTIVGAGTTTIKAKASETADFEEKEISYTLTVKPKTLTKDDLTHSGSITKVYDGSTNAPSGLTVSVDPSSLVNGDTLTVNGTLKFNSANVGEASEITFTPTAITTGNYTLAATEVLTIRNASITAKEVTITDGINATDRSYEKNNKTVALTKGALALTGLVIGETLDVNVPATGTISDATVGTYNVTYSGVTLKDGTTGKARNYKLVDSLPTVTVTISKAAAPVLADIPVSFKYTVTTGEKTIGSVMPDDADTLTYSKGTESKTGSVTVTSWAVDPTTGKVTYTLSNGATNDAVTLPVTIVSTNYEDATVNVVITLTARDNQVELRITGGTTVVYGQTLALNTSGGSGSGAVTYTVVNGTGEATIDPNTGVLTPVKVGSVSVIATKAGDNDYNAVTSAPVEITITKATPTGEPKYTEIKTGGKTLADAALTIEGSTLKPNAGTLEWVDDKGNVLSNDTKVEANTTYKWRFTPTDGNYTVLTGSIELYHKSSSGGSGWYYTYYTIKATAGTNGSISPSGWTSVRDGRDQTFTITPDKGYAVAKVLVDGKSVGAVKSYTFKNVTKDHTIEAIFMKSNGNPQTGVFVDVAEGSYYEEAIDWAVEKGITNGVSSNMFAPNDPCTRAQIVTFLWRATGSPAPKSVSSFTDVPADAFYAKAVAWAVENGITSGTGESKFSPNSTCTRAQAVTFLYRASGSPAVSGKAEFSDVSTTAFYADAVAWAAKKGITTGIGGGLFGSDNDCTRGQIVTFLWRAMAE